MKATLISIAACISFSSYAIAVEKVTCSVSFFEKGSDVPIDSWSSIIDLAQTDRALDLYSIQYAKDQDNYRISSAKYESHFLGTVEKPVAHSHFSIIYLQDKNRETPCAIDAPRFVQIGWRWWYERSYLENSNTIGGSRNYDSVDPRVPLYKEIVYDMDDRFRATIQCTPQ